MVSTLHCRKCRNWDNRGPFMMNSSNTDLWVEMSLLPLNLGAVFLLLSWGWLCNKLQSEDLLVASGLRLFLPS